MYSICLDDDEPEADPDWERIEHAQAGVATPSTTSEHPESETDRQPRRYEDTSEGSDEEFGGSTQIAPKRKKGGYDSRIEQILYENPDLPILIVDAGKSLENGGKFIVYTIRTGVSPQSSSDLHAMLLTSWQDLEVRRRYSEFASLRDALSRLHPTLIIPPIPEKHTMADYAANPTKAKQDQQIIDLRKRMLAVFLNRCRQMDDVRNDGVWWRFLDPNASWVSSMIIVILVKLSLMSPRMRFCILTLLPPSPNPI